MPETGSLANSDRSEAGDARPEILASSVRLAEEPVGLSQGSQVQSLKREVALKKGSGTNRAKCLNTAVLVSGEALAAGFYGRIIRS